MKISKSDYQKLVKQTAPKSPIWKDCLLAFLMGGAICTIGQMLLFCYEKLSLKPEDIKTLVSVSLIFLAALLTAIGIFDKIAKYAGAGTLVPITGFANSVVSPAIEYKAEGFILGTAAKMFTIAGPVIVYGTVASVIYGIIYWIIKIA